MRFLADMGLDVWVVEWLRRQGHDARHLRDEGLQRTPDREIFDKAISEARIVLTFDLDFGEIAALSRGCGARVILFRLHHARTPHVIARLGAVLERSGDVLEHGSVVLVEDARHSHPAAPHRRRAAVDLWPSTRPLRPHGQRAVPPLPAHGLPPDGRAAGTAGGGGDPRDGETADLAHHALLDPAPLLAEAAIKHAAG